MTAKTYSCSMCGRVVVSAFLVLTFDCTVPNLMRPHGRCGIMSA